MRVTHMEKQYLFDFAIFSLLVITIFSLGSYITEVNQFISDNENINNLYLQGNILETAKRENISNDHSIFFDCIKSGIEKPSCERADFNNDGKLNYIDGDIFSNLKIFDLNSDGKIDGF